MSKIFHGSRVNGDVGVWCDADLLELPSDVLMLNDHEYDWGRASPGTVKLAAAILLACTERSVAIAWTHKLAHEWLAKITEDTWRITEDQLARWICDETLRELTGTSNTRTKRP